MTEEERYGFDLQGYMVIENAIPPDALAAMNGWLDAQQAIGANWQAAYPSLLNWGPEFRALLDNAKVLPILIELLGDQLRLDHDYAIFSEAGDSGMGLHGGGTPYDPSQYYHIYNGRMYNGLTVVSYALADVPLGQGGLAVVPGSHKSAFRCPDDIRHWRTLSPLVKQVPVKAGDCVIFTEALTHGTFPWTAHHQRRSLFYKYSPKHLTWAQRYYVAAEGNPGVEAIISELTERQRILLDPPSVNNHRHVTPG